MANIFPEGSYFYFLFQMNPNLIIEIRTNGVSVYDSDLDTTGFSQFKAETSEQEYLKDIAENIMDLA